MTDKVPTPKVFCGRHNQITRTQMSITVSLIEEKPLDAFAIGLRGFWGGYKLLLLNRFFDIVTPFSIPTDV